MPLQRSKRRCGALEPQIVTAGRSYFGRVAATYVQGPPKGGGALWLRRVLNTRL